MRGKNKHFYTHSSCNLGSKNYIVEPMRVLLEEMKLHTYAPNLYLFGGDGNGYKPALHEKDQYGLKLTGNIDYLLKHKEKADLT